MTTIGKLINRFNLADKIGNHENFKKATKFANDEIYCKYRESEVRNRNLTRLVLYKESKDEFKVEKYLEMVNFENRKVIAKIRCSDHCLQIEKGRHRNISRAERICRVCDNNEIATKEHFPLKCNKYDPLRNKYNIRYNTI